MTIQNSICTTNMKTLIDYISNENKLSEGLLSGMDDTLSKGDNLSLIYEYVNFLAASVPSGHQELDGLTKDDINSIADFAIEHGILSCNKKGEIICDRSMLNRTLRTKENADTYNLTYSLILSSIGICMNTKFITKGLKNIIFKNFERPVSIYLFGDNNLSAFNIEIDNTVGLNIYPNDSNNVVKLGKVTCSKFIMYDFNNSRPVGVSFKTGSSIESIDLSGCNNIETISAKNINLDNIILNSNIVKHNLIKNGLATSKTIVRLS